MKFLFAVKSAVEAFGWFFIIMRIYCFAEQPESVEKEIFLYAAIAAFCIVNAGNKFFRWQGENFEIDECPYCGATLEWEEVEEE